MENKIYVFGIGGTGSRVLKSLTMLLAAGVDCGVNTIVPIIIDKDKSNGDYTKTSDIIDEYIAVNNEMSTNTSSANKNKFFKTKIKLLNSGLLLELKDNDQCFENFLGLLSTENRALTEILFSRETLDMDMKAGFRGNPNMGSVVLNQFDQSPTFDDFANDFTSGDKIFIISSIFGGTGASGFPLLRKILHEPRTDGKYANWGIVNNAPLGAITILPYYKLESGKINSSEWNDKTKAALHYYKSEDKGLDTLYYIGTNNRTTYFQSEDTVGGANQKDPAHIVEMAAAMAILDFANPENDSDNIHRNGNNEITKTNYKEFAIEDDSQSDFTMFCENTINLVTMPLSRFLLFSKYMGYHVIEEKKDTNRELIVKKIAKNIYESQGLRQNFANVKDREFNKISIKKLESIQKNFVEWLLEMEEQDFKFSPFNLTTTNANDFIKGKIILFNETWKVKDWSSMDSKLNDLSDEMVKNKKDAIDIKQKTSQIFLELFYRATGELLTLISGK